MAKHDPIDWAVIKGTDVRSTWYELAIPPSGIFDILTNAASVIRTSADIVSTFLNVIKAIIDTLKAVASGVSSGKDFLQEILDKLASLLDGVFGGQGFHLFISKPFVVQEVGDYYSLVTQFINSLDDTYDVNRPEYSDDAAIGGFFLVAKTKINLAFNIPAVGIPEFPDIPDVDLEWPWEQVKMVEPQIELEAKSIVYGITSNPEELKPEVNLRWDAYLWPKFNPAYQKVWPCFVPYKVFIYRDTKPLTNNTYAHESNIIATLDYDFTSLQPAVEYYDADVSPDTDYWYGAGFAYKYYLDFSAYVNGDAPLQDFDTPPLMSNIVHVFTKKEKIASHPAPPPNWYAYRLPIVLFPPLMNLANVLKNFIDSAKSASGVASGGFLDAISKFLGDAASFYNNLSEEIGGFLDQLNDIFGPLAGVWSFYMADKTGGNTALVENLKYMLGSPDDMSDGPPSLRLSPDEPLTLDVALEELTSFTKAPTHETSVGSEGPTVDVHPFNPLQFGKPPEFKKNDLVTLVCMTAGSEDNDGYGDIKSFIDFLKTFFGSADEDKDELSDVISEIETATGVLRNINLNAELELGIAAEPEVTTPPVILGDDLEESETGAAECPA